MFGEEIAGPLAYGLWEWTRSGASYLWTKRRARYWTPTPALVQSVVLDPRGAAGAVVVTYEYQVAGQWFGGEFERVFLLFGEERFAARFRVREYCAAVYDPQRPERSTLAFDDRVWVAAGMRRGQAVRALESARS